MSRKIAFNSELENHYLCDWTDRAGDSNIEDGMLMAFFEQRGKTAAQISRALGKQHRQADNCNYKLYRNNEAMYHL